MQVSTLLQKTIHGLSSLLAPLVYRFPSRQFTLIGVTGASGTQTASVFLYSILRQTGKSVGLLTERKQLVDEKELKSNKKRPPSSLNPLQLQRVLRELLYRGCEYAVIEMTPATVKNTSNFGTYYSAVAFTHSPETTGSPLGKQKFLQLHHPIFKRAERLVLNKDDALYPYAVRINRGQKISYAIEQEAQVKALKLQSGDWGTFFYYVNSNSVWKNQLSFDRSIKIDLEPSYAPSALAAIATACSLNIPDFRIKRGIESTSQLDFFKQ